MNKEFVEILIKIIEENGKEIFQDVKRTKGLLMDYAKGEHKNLIDLLTHLTHE